MLAEHGAPANGENGSAARSFLRGQPRHQVVDPSVSREKFRRELDGYQRHEPEYRQQGWLLLSANFPEVFLVLTVPRLRPAPVLFGVVIDFSNYDVDPPSVSLVNPWTQERLRAAELLSPLPRLAPASAHLHPDAMQRAEPAPSPVLVADVAPVGQEAPPIFSGATGIVHLLQWWTPESVPFLCIRGVREYHRHPAHTADAWLLHRGRGEGTLAAILGAIHEHGAAPIQDYTYDFIVQNQRTQHNAFAQLIAGRVRGFINALPDGQLYQWPA